MTEQFEYQVDKVGQVINIKTLKGEDYQLTSQKVDSMPLLTRTDRWAQFKRAIAFQELDIVFKYSGFKDAEELKRARNVISRTKDNFLMSALNGTKIKANVDNLNLVLYVVRVNEN